ncbi:MAG: GNAT family N-acetyltransferase [Atopobiaceae bacterium]
MAFPQTEDLSKDEADGFFSQQTYTGIVQDTDTGEIVGLYILHPNNVGRVGHICNASYAVRKDVQGEHVGERLVRDCLEKAHEKGFRILQFNAVVASIVHAIHLYERLGFVRIGMVPGGYHMPDGSYEDIILYYHTV